jgi:small redox-active disulfide protein 2
VKIQILGTGCPKCKKTTENAKKAVEMSCADAEIVKVEKINDIMGFGVMMTPALAIDGDVKVSGKIPSPDQIVEWIKKAK